MAAASTPTAAAPARASGTQRPAHARGGYDEHDAERDDQQAPPHRHLRRTPESAQQGSAKSGEPEHPGGQPVPGGVGGPGVQRHREEGERDQRDAQVHRGHHCDRAPGGGRASQGCVRRGTVARTSTSIRGRHRDRQDECGAARTITTGTQGSRSGWPGGAAVRRWRHRRRRRSTSTVTSRSVAERRRSPAIPGIAATIAGYAGVASATARVHSPTASQVVGDDRDRRRGQQHDRATRSVRRTIRSRRIASASRAVSQETAT